MAAQMDLRSRANSTASDRERGAALDDALKDTFPASDPVAMLEPAAGDPVAPTVVAPEVRARQGVTGHNVRYVLAWSIAGAVLAFIVIYLLYRL